MTDRRRIVILTGLSGAGVSSALKALEDQGYEAVDNLPLSLFNALIEERDLLARDIAVAIDARTRGFSSDTLLAHRERLAVRADTDPVLVYLNCNDAALQRRFTETRRRHPLAHDRPVLDAIRHERRLFEAVKQAADLVIDTSDMTMHDLRRLMEGHLTRAGTDREMVVQILSFSYKHGVPREADLIFDVRFLRNPHYVDTLREQSGLNSDVQAYIRADHDFDGFIQGVTGLLAPLLPRYRHEGKAYLTIAFGCTGGKHRSVFVASLMADKLRQMGTEARLSHRDLPRAL